MEIQENSRVGDLVAENYRVSDVFRKYDIDFCCGGKQTLKSLCDKRGLDFEKLSAEIASVDQFNLGEPSIPYKEWPLDTLVNYIEERHHAYVNRTTVTIKAYAAKVAMVHGHVHAETLTINNLFGELAEELAAHMKKEELILFPYAVELAQSRRTCFVPGRPFFESALNPVSQMEDDHTRAGELVHEIALLSDNYTPPAEACQTYRVLYAKLKEFQDDLHAHIHLENNILFPEMIRLEKELRD